MYAEIKSHVRSIIELMLERFNTYIINHNLFNKTDKILLAVSGGKDSMAMLHLFQSNKLKFSVAHCNFQLRNNASDLDEQFVKDFTANNNITFYSKAFETKEYARQKSISIQMAARKLRYDWLKEIREEKGYEYIATAHHKNDVAETMLINLTKGTGLSGLHGIKNKNRNVIRPMLCFTAAEIDNYVQENNISFREDLSNSDTKYIRNSIRHKIIPELEKINSSIIKTLNTEAKQFLGDEKIISDKVIEEKKRLFLKDRGIIKIKIEELKKLNPLNSYLYYFIREYGFNISDVDNIIDGLSTQSGKIYSSLDHIIVKDREFLILKKIEENFTQKKEIVSIEDFPFRAQVVEITPGFNINDSSDYAYLDMDKIKWPLILRAWNNGDTFQPLGMKGNKKVSDFLIDAKVSLIDKINEKILESNGEILWLVGRRISDRFKVTDTTKKALVLSLND